MLLRSANFCLSLSLSPATKKPFRERKVGGGGKDLRKEECDGGRNYP